MRNELDKQVVVTVEGRHLKELNARPNFFQYLNRVWGRRFFIASQAKAQANRATRQYRLWRMWVIVSPFLDVALYAFVFGVLLDGAREVPNFAGFVMIGVIFMRMITGMLMRGSLLLQQSKGLVKGFYFPNSCIVLAQTGRHVIENVMPGLIAVIGALTLQAPAFSWTALLIIPVFVLIHLFGCGLMLLSACLSAFLPDLDAIVRVFSQMWFFLSGVMYPIDRFSNLGTIYVLMENNPAHVFLKVARETVMYGTIPNLETWGILVVWALSSLSLGLIVFWLTEPKLARAV